MGIQGIFEWSVTIAHTPGRIVDRANQNAQMWKSLGTQLTVGGAFSWRSCALRLACLDGEGAASEAHRVFSAVALTE